jgi:hypothetical protein
MPARISGAAHDFDGDHIADVAIVNLQSTISPFSSGEATARFIIRLAITVRGTDPLRGELPCLCR